LRPSVVLAGLAVLLVAAAAVAATAGAYRLSLVDLAQALAGHGSPTARTVVWNIRLPRVGAAATVGAGLAAAGCAYQSLFRNPLVSPDILGVSSGAGLGAVVGILLGWPVWAIQLSGFGAGLAVVAAVLAIGAALRGGDDLLVLVLAGIVVGALAGAAIALAKVLADPYDQLPAITFWLLGSLAGVKAADLLGLVPPVLVGLLPLALMRWRIGVLALGHDEARSLGVEAGALRIVVVCAATLMTSAAVAMAGVIGWVGLMVPHMARLLVGPRFDRLLPASVLLGAAFMIGVDTLARSAARIEIPLGVLTALIGGPVFVALLAHGRRRRA
jgi:iron complex transport system permease protein